MSGTLLILVIVLILLEKLPEADTGNYSNITSCADDSPLNPGDRKAFWVSHGDVYTL